MVEKVFEFTNQTGEEKVEIEVEPNTRWKGIVLLSKMNESNVSFVVRLQEGAAADLQVLALGEGKEQGQFQTSIIHLEPNTRANVQVKAVLDGESKFTFNGLIKVLPPAQKTQSYLREDVLLLSKDARSFGQPQLEIEANDVKASHGSTIGRIDEDQLFYLASRGVSSDDGKKLIVRGFIDSILRQISDNSYVASNYQKITA